MRAFIESVKRGVKPPLDVYDAVSMSVISPLSEKSISNGSSSVEFPDFTRGAWKIINQFLVFQICKENFYEKYYFNRILFYF